MVLVSSSGLVRIMITESAFTSVPGRIRMRCTLPSVVAGTIMVFSGTRVPSPRTSRVIGPRLTVSFQTTEPSTVGAAGFSRLSAYEVPTTTMIPNTIIRIRRISRLRLASLRGMSIGCSAR